MSRLIPILWSAAGAGWVSFGLYLGDPTVIVGGTVILCLAEVWREIRQLRQEMEGEA